ncbi:MAG: energy transducer TonB, partial [Bacteroidota bacterium]
MKKERKDHQFIKKPYYEGGISAMRMFIKKHLVYPEIAKKRQIEGTVYLRYTINQKGEVIDSKVIRGIGHGCDEEATRLVRLLKFKVPKNRRPKLLFH